MQRSKRRQELLKGPLLYGVVIVASTLWFWRDAPAGVMGLAVLCMGDGLAEVVGRRFGVRKLPHNRQKVRGSCWHRWQRSAKVLSCFKNPKESQRGSWGTPGSLQRAETVPVDVRRAMPAAPHAWWAALQQQRCWPCTSGATGYSTQQSKHETSCWPQRQRRRPACWQSHSRRGFSTTSP